MGEDFVFDWTDKLGFRENPFHTEIPDDVKATYAGYEEERRTLNKFVLEQDDFGTIVGDPGAGKTMLLHWLRRHASQEVLVTYLDAAEVKTERDLIEGLIAPVLSVPDRLLRRHTQVRLGEVGKFIYQRLDGQLLILVDNVSSLPQRYHDLFTYFFDNDLSVQLVTAGTERTSITEESFSLELEGLSDEALHTLVERRVSFYGRTGIFPFEEDALDELIADSDGNPGAFLERCREAAIELALDDDYMEDKDRSASDGLISIQWGDEPEPGDLDLDIPAPEEETTSEPEKITSETVDDQDSSEERDEESSEAEKTEEMLEELTREFDKE